jgi:hypothetical protein
LAAALGAAFFTAAVLEAAGAADFFLTFEVAIKFPEVRYTFYTGNLIEIFGGRFWSPESSQKTPSQSPVRYSTHR